LEKEKDGKTQVLQVYEKGRAHPACMQVLGLVLVMRHAIPYGSLENAWSMLA